MLSTHDDTGTSRRIGAGAFAYVIKTAHPDDLRSAVRQPSALGLPAGARPAGCPHEASRRESHARLTRRELELLQLVSEGYTNAQMARMLCVTEQTVKFHLTNVYRKLDVSNRTEACRWAQLHGVLSTSASSATAG